MNDLPPIIESLLFVADGPLSIDQIKEVLPDAPGAAIRQAIEDLKAEYDNRQGGFVLHEVAGGFQFRTRAEYREYIHRLFRPGPTRLSRAAMETLAIVAYHQPVLRSEVEHIRGVNSGNTLRFLLDRKLIRVLGRREVPGRPLVYGTTKKFLETFDLNSLKDLPVPDEIEPPGDLPGQYDDWQPADLPLGEPADDYPEDPAEDDGAGENNA